MPWPNDPDTELFAASDPEDDRQNTGIHAEADLKRISKRLPTSSANVMPSPVLPLGVGETCSPPRARCG